MYPFLWRKQFDADFPPTADPSESLRINALYNTTSGSTVYSWVTGSASFLEEPHITSRYLHVIQNFETRRESEGRAEEITRRLAWLSDQAAGKFRAAWEALNSGLPLTDPSSGAAFDMRSALDLTVKEALLKRTPAPWPEEKKDYLKHIAAHAARSLQARSLLDAQAQVYPNLTSRLSKVKGTTELDRRALMTLFFEAQELLYIILEAIDPSRLSPKT